MGDCGKFLQVWLSGTPQFVCMLSCRSAILGLLQGVTQDEDCK
jgi:hypothetical protein